MGLVTADTAQSGAAYSAEIGGRRARIPEVPDTGQCREGDQGDGTEAHVRLPRGLPGIRGCQESGLRSPFTCEQLCNSCPAGRGWAPSSGSAEDLRGLGYVSRLHPEDSAIAAPSGGNGIHGRDIDARLSQLADGVSNGTHPVLTLDQEGYLGSDESDLGLARGLCR